MMEKRAAQCLLLATLFILFSGALFSSQSEIKHSVLPLKSVLEANPTIQKTTLRKSIHLNFEPFPIASSEDSTYATPEIPEAFLLSIPQGSVYTNWGNVLVNDTLIQELIWPWSVLKRKPEQLGTIPPAHSIEGTVAVLAQEGYRNYYHWLLEVLPKMALLEQSGIHYDYLYLPETNLPFQRETLELMGIDTSKVIEGYSQTHIRATKLIAPSYVSRSCYTPAWVATYLRDRLMKDLKPSSETPRKLFISRSKAPQRRILNENEIAKYLENRGFTTVHLEGLTVREQMILFSNADIIVAPHGAGLANILFAQPGTRVIEIFQALEDETYCYLSQTLDLDYHAIATTDFLPNGRTLDTIVDWECLKFQLDPLLETQNTPDWMQITCNQ